MKKFLPIFILVLFVSCREVANEETYDAVALSPTHAEISTSSEQIPVKQKIIKRATLKFETADLEKTRTQIQKAIEEAKAQVQREDEGKEYSSIYKRITIRVPSQNFEKLVASIGNGVSYFDEKIISSEDVTAQFIDTEARLKTKKILEARYLELLKKASKVSEMLEIEQKLSEVREEIESKEGQLKYMQNEVSMSSVNVEFYKVSPSESGVTQSFGTEMANALETGFLALSSLFLWFLEVWPFIIILVALFLLIRRRFKRKKA